MAVADGSDKGLSAAAAATAMRHEGCSTVCLELELFAYAPPVTDVHFVQIAIYQWWACHLELG